LKVLTAPARPEEGEKIQPAHIKRILEVLSHSYDFVIVDLPRHINDNTIATLDAANMVCLVANNQLTCLKSTRL
jgi:Flp pilus assembly CpaE family ATPase